MRATREPQPTGTKISTDHSDYAWVHVTNVRPREVLAVVRARWRADIVQGRDELVSILAHKTQTQVEHGVRIGGADAREPNGGCRPSLVEAETASHGLAQTKGEE